MVVVPAIACGIALHIGGGFVDVACHLSTIAAPVALRIAVRIAVASADGELATLHGTEHVGSYAALSVVVGAYGERIALHALACGDDINDASHSLGIILGSGIGDDFYLLHAVGRHVLEHLGGIVRHHVVGFAVDIDLERRTVVHHDVVLPVDCHHRHLA